MAYKVTKKSFKGDMLLLNEVGKESEKGKWYFLSEPVQAFAKKINVGAGSELETIETEQRGKDTYITKLKTSGDSQAVVHRPTYQGSAPAKNTSWGQKSPEESEKITRLSVLSSVSNIVAQLQLTDVEEIKKVSSELFRSFLAEIKNGLNLAPKQEEEIPY